MSPAPYARGVPTPQNALDIFAGEWTSLFPAALGPVTAGRDALFDDPRIHWALAQFCTWGVDPAGATALDLGPLECGHSYMLLQAGARSVTAVEANRTAFLKCLVTKELLGLRDLRLLHGDAVAFLEADDAPCDIALASGLLYHLTNPVRLIERLAARSRAIFLWTMVYDADFNRANLDRAVANGPAYEVEQGGFTHTLHQHAYANGTDFSRFWGGGDPTAAWMTRADVLAALAHFGFTRQAILDEDNLNGRALQVAATRA